MYFGAETSEDEAFLILDAFVEEGGTLIDTADVYAGGVAEQVVGRWIASRPREVVDRIVLATKGRFGTGPDVNDTGLSRRHLHRALDASLIRLGVDTIDLYQMHGWDPQTPLEETIAFLNDAVKTGKVHYIGLSNFTGWQLQLFVSTAKSMGLHAPATLQQQYSLLSRESEWEVIPAALHNDIGLLPWSPLAGGFLTGKYTRGASPAANTRAGSDNVLYQWVSAEYAEVDRNWKVIEAVNQIASRMGATSAQVALSWLEAQPGVTAPICGARTLKHLKDNLGATELVLDRADAEHLSNLSKPTPGGYPYGAFGSGQRDRSLQTSAQSLGEVVGQGSKYPLGHA
ncbi:aldo/keto reductase [Xanthomonas citri]|nr:aldo/keto reductase [Xanthomonas citri]QQK70076.1 aldo/keto reductase [Xanthomonas citri]